MQVLYFIILIFYTNASYCTRHIPSVEASFYHNVIREHPNTNGLICPSNDEMIGSCIKLFRRPHYRYQMKVHLNNGVYLNFSKSHINLCEKHRVTFRAEPGKLPTDRVEQMFPCFGRRSTIRTNSQVDDYLKKFYLSYCSKKKTYYVFQAEQHGTPKVQYTFYEEILHNSWERIASKIDHHIDGDEYLREKVLHTVEMFINWPQEIENIFVNEMILAETPRLNQLASLHPSTLISLCVFILRNSGITDETFLLDVNKMKDVKPKPHNIKLYFDTEIQFNDQSHEGYACHGKHSSNKPSQNRKYLNMFVLASGPQENTFFLFSYLANKNHYMIRSFIANVNFNNFYQKTDNIFETFKPDPAGPSQPPGFSQLPAPPRPPAPYGFSRPVVPSMPQTQGIPPAPYQHFRLQDPSTSYEYPMHPTPSGQFTFPVTSLESPTFYSPSETSAPSTFPPYQVAPAVPSGSAAPSSSHSLLAPPTTTAAETPEHFKPSNT